MNLVKSYWFCTSRIYVCFCVGEGPNIGPTCLVLIRRFSKLVGKESEKLAHAVTCGHRASSSMIAVFYFSAYEESKVYRSKKKQKQKKQQRSKSKFKRGKTEKSCLPIGSLKRVNVCMG